MKNILFKFEITRFEPQNITVWKYCKNCESGREYTCNYVTLFNSLIQSTECMFCEITLQEYELKCEEEIKYLNKKYNEVVELEEKRLASKKDSLQRRVDAQIDMLREIAKDLIRD